MGKTCEKSVLWEKKQDVVWEKVKVSVKIRSKTRKKRVKLTLKILGVWGLKSVKL